MEPIIIENNLAIRPPQGSTVVRKALTSDPLGTGRFLITLSVTIIDRGKG